MDPVRQTLLKLVSRGNAIIAELLRLSEHIPSPFLQIDKDDIRKVYHFFRLISPSPLKKYGEVLFDFRFLGTADACEQRVQSRPVCFDSISRSSKVSCMQDLIEADEELRLNHLARLERFYVLFESVFKYVQDLRQFMDNLSNGIYISHTYESVLSDTDGKQLFSEAIYLYGVMLLVLDARIEGVVRERMIVAYYRSEPPRRATCARHTACMQRTLFSVHGL